MQGRMLELHEQQRDELLRQPVLFKVPQVPERSYLQLRFHRSRLDRLSVQRHAQPTLRLDRIQERQGARSKVGVRRVQSLQDDGQFLVALPLALFVLRVPL